MNTQKKHLKKKERERKAKQKVLRRRARIRAEAKEEREKSQADREAQKVVNRHTVTVCYDKSGRMSEEEVKARLAQNMQILQALEAEYEAEQKMREENRKNFPDYLEKLKQQSAQALEQHQTRVSNWGGSADVEFNPNPTPEDLFNDPPVGNGLKPSEEEKE